MRWDDFRRSDNVEDRRGDGGGGFGGGGGGGFGIPIGGGGLGIGTMVVLGLIGWAFGIDPLGPDRRRRNSHRRTGQDPAIKPLAAASRPARTGAPTDDTGTICLGVLGNTEDTLEGDFPGARPAISRAAAACCSPARSIGGCGMAQAAMGPFYCPNDQQIYLDTSFFRRSRRASAAAPAMPANSRRPM